jgi:hypothetical protein
MLSEQNLEAASSLVYGTHPKAAAFPDDGASCVGTCTPKLVAQSPSAAFVVAEGPNICWSGAEWTDGRIWTAPITGGTAVTLATGQSNPWALRVVDYGAVRSNRRTIMRCTREADAGSP